MTSTPSVIPALSRAALLLATALVVGIAPSSGSSSPTAAARPAALPGPMALAPLEAASAMGLRQAPPRLPSQARASGGLADHDARPAWRGAARDGWQLIDDFDGPSWPRSSDWPLVADLNAPFVGGGGYPWAPSPCESTPGTRTLRAVGGGDGAALDCDAAYPGAVASSALLSLDLSQLLGARIAELRFDLWVEADPDEGLLLQLLRFEDDGRVAERRVIYSATGRSARWARGQSVDLTRLRDAREPTWRHDLRGERAYLEFLFVSTDGGDGGARGVLLDNLGLEVTMAVPSATPVPSRTPTPPPGATAVVPSPTPAGTPVERTNLCTDIRNCHTLTVRAWIDRGCDGRNQVGHDAPLAGEPYVALRVGAAQQAQQLGTSLSRSGRALFAFPPSDVVAASLELPQGFQMCPGSDNPRRLTSDDFNRYGRAALDFRVQRLP